MKLSHFAIAASLLFSSLANAGVMHFTGNIEYHSDIVVTHFTLDSEASNVRMWTDSFQDGTNFDPITALWKADGSLINENDDDDNINPATQTEYDSGFSFGTLAAGDYFFTVATYSNWAQGSNFADGFLYDSQTPVAMADWAQPSNGFNMGSFWSVWIDGVDYAYQGNPPTVPEPASIAILGLALAGLGFMRKRKNA